MNEKLKYSLPDFDGFSFPTKDLINFGLDHNLADSPGLLMHTFLCRILTLYLSKNLPKNIVIDLDLALSLTTLYHFSRQESDYGKDGKSKCEETNEFMKQNSDIDYAVFKATKYGFDENIIEGTRNFLNNPKTRKKYFPNETLETDGNINWSIAIPVLASWLVSGAITNTQDRFNDLKNRRSGELGEIELDHIRNLIELGEDITIPKAILDIIIKEDNFDIKTKNDLLNLIKLGKITNEIMGLWILLGYEEYANKIIYEYCKLCEINDFHGFLKEGLCLVKNEEKKEEIRGEFEKYLQRKLQENEIIPYLPGIELVFRRLYFLKIDKIKKNYKYEIIKILKNLERITKKLKRKKLI